MPQVEEEEEESYQDVEKKLAINHMEGAIVMSDINSQNKGKNEWSIVKSGFVMLYICIFFGAAGLCFMSLNLYMYAVQGLGGSALDSTLLQTCLSCGQLFGSPLLHLLSEKVGRKPIYSLTFLMYVITMVGLLFADEKYFGSFALGWMYIIRVIQGFFAIVQPLAFTIISDVVPPNQRAFATSLNNIIYLIGMLFVTVMNGFVMPKIPGVYPDNDNYQIFKSSIYAGIIFTGIGFLLTFTIKETCPNVLLRREAKRLGTVYRPLKKDEISMGEAFKFIFGQPHMFMLFVAYIFGFGTPISNQNVNSVIIAKAMDMRTQVESYIIMSVMSGVGIVCMLLFTFTIYKPLIKKFGDIRILIFVLLFSCITSVLRCTPPPLNRVQYCFSAIFSTFGSSLVDAPFITFASMQTTPRSRGKVMGVFMIANSIARAALSAIGGALMDWHWRNAGIVFLFFTFASITCLCFVRTPNTM